MDFKEIQDLLKLVNKTDLTEVEIEREDFRILIRREPAEKNVIYTTSQPPVHSSHPTHLPSVPHHEFSEAGNEGGVQEKKQASASPSNLYEFRSPMIGTFYRSSSPDADPFIKVGDHIEKGQVVCIVEAMKLFNEIESEIDGKVVKILIEDSQPVEYDQVLFLVDTNA
ncbi:MAG: acetyl-CoA carboxylase biotin carboxyl carrier protein [Bacteroidia bacterium]|nr:acetyl-CoA carboxylase biotin carboxyl carrier protein [Bacteroidia bacterium]